MPRKRLIVVGSGHEAFRRYALVAMQQQADLVLFNPVEVSWQQPYIVEAHVVDVTDLDAMLKLAHTVGADGVITFDELSVVIAAELARALNLPHTDPKAMQRCKDKHAQRRALALNGLSPVDYGLAEDPQQAREIACRIGYPVVFKPLALGGSIGVIRVATEEEVDGAFELASNATSGDGHRSSVAGVLIEQYLDGPEYSVDCVTWEGITHPVVVAEKSLGFAPYFEEIGHVVSAAPHSRTW